MSCVLSQLQLPDDQMALSIYVEPKSSSIDIYAVYVSFGTNETLLEPPTESNFDLVFITPNRTFPSNISQIDAEVEHQLRHTIFMPPSVHRGNGTYIFGIKLISKFKELRTAIRKHPCSFRFNYRNELNRLQLQLSDQYVCLEMSVLA